jgi:hypothetical protein
MTDESTPRTPQLERQCVAGPTPRTESKKKAASQSEKVLILWSLGTIPPFTASLVDLLMMVGKQVC